MEDDVSWKMIFDWKHFWLEDILWWKTTFDVPGAPQNSLPFLNQYISGPSYRSEKNESMDILFQKHKLKIF